MTEYRNTFELNFRRSKGESAGVGVADTVAVRRGTITIPGGSTGLILTPTIAPITSERIQEAELIVTSGTEKNMLLKTWRGLTGWSILTGGLPAATGHTWEINAGTDQSVIVQAVGFDYKDVLQFSGAAAVAINSLSGPQTLEWKILVSKNLVVGNATSVLFDTYVDDQLDTLPDLGPLSARTLNQLHAQGGAFLVLAVSGNQQISVNNASGAYGYGPPIILATDVGLGFGQIPAEPADWTAARFGAHPRVFIRHSGSHSWGVKQLSPAAFGSTEVTLADDTDMEPLIASRRPSHSLWRILLEGELIDVIVAHPIGLDLRRPRDIWNRVWAAAIGGAELPIFGTYGVGGFRRFYQRGLLRNLHFLDYAYCLDLFDDGNTPLITLPDPPPG